MLINRSYTWALAQDGASIAFLLLILSSVGLLYWPDRAKGFIILSLIMSVITFIGLFAFISAFEGFLDFMTKPKPN